MAIIPTLVQLALRALAMAGRVAPRVASRAIQNTINTAGRAASQNTRRRALDEGMGTLGVNRALPIGSRANPMKITTRAFPDDPDFMPPPKLAVIKAPSSGRYVKQQSLTPKNLKALNEAVTNMLDENTFLGKIAKGVLPKFTSNIPIKDIAGQLSNIPRLMPASRIVSSRGASVTGTRLLKTPAGNLEVIKDNVIAGTPKVLEYAKKFLNIIPKKYQRYVAYGVASGFISGGIGGGIKAFADSEDKHNNQTKKSNFEKRANNTQFKTQQNPNFGYNNNQYENKGFNKNTEFKAYNVNSKFKY